MNGVSPRPSSLTFPQSQISSTVNESVPTLPLVVTDLIAQFADIDLSHAQRPLMFNTDGQLIDCEENSETLAAIKALLISTDAEPDLKQTIFRHFEQAFSNNTFTSYKQHLNSILDEIRREGDQIILNCIDLSGILLMGLDLSGASMVAAKFDGANLYSIQLKGADLTGSSFRQAQFVRSMLSGATMAKSVFDRTEFDRVEMSGVDLTGAGYYNAVFKYTTASGMISDDVSLQSVIQRSTFQAGKTTTDPKLNTVLNNYVRTHPKLTTGEIVILHGQFSSGKPGAINNWQNGQG